MVNELVLKLLMDLGDCQWGGYIITLLAVHPSVPRRTGTAVLVWPGVDTRGSILARLLPGAHVQI